MEYPDERDSRRDSARNRARRAGLLPLQPRAARSTSCYERLSKLVPEARIAIAHGQMREHALEDVMLDFTPAEVRRAAVHDDHRIRSGYPDGEHADHLRRGSLRAGSALSDARAASAARTGWPTPISRFGRARCSPKRRRSASTRFANLRSSARASASRCAIWSCAARATCSARSRAATSPTSATICIASCWRKRFWRRRAKRPSRTATWRRAWMCTSTPISRRNTSRATTAAGGLQAHRLHHDGRAARRR